MDIMNTQESPRKSTVYISNIPYDLKNNDIHKLFDKYGKIVKVTIVKDKTTRKSKGVAFILFLHQDDAIKCVEGTNGKDFFGRTLKSSIAKDNGRSTEFIKKRIYPDKSYCYECGESGHLSYACSANLLGARDPPPKKKRKRKPKLLVQTSQEINIYSNVDADEPEDNETLSAAIAAEHERFEQEKSTDQFIMSTSTMGDTVMPKKIKKSSYFSDEEESE